MRKAGPPREMVRFTPGQFSVLTALGVLMVFAALAAGYRWGVMDAGRKVEGAVPGKGAGPVSQGAILLGEGVPMAAPGATAAAPSLTFYDELVEASASAKALADGSADRRAAETSDKPVEKRPSREERIHSPAKGDIFVQVGSYPSEKAGKEALAELQGHQGRVVRADLGSKGVWFRVQVGPFSQMAEAEKALSALARKGYKGFITK